MTTPKLTFMPLCTPTVVPCHPPCGPHTHPSPLRLSKHLALQVRGEDGGACVLGVVGVVVAQVWPADGSPRHRVTTPLLGAWRAHWAAVWVCQHGAAASHTHTHLRTATLLLTGGRCSSMGDISS